MKTMNDAKTKHVNGTVRPIDLAEVGLEADSWFLLDVRTPGEFAGAHIEGSANIPLGDLKRALDGIELLAEGKPIALICRTGRRAKEAHEILSAAKVEPCCVLEGGVEAWQNTGLPLLRGEAGMSLERQVRIAAGLLVVFGVALGWLVHPGFLGLAAFVGAGLAFAGITDTCGMAMMLAKMPWNRGPVACTRITETR